ncbi:hypothetical protein BH10PSE2_BH10PSE2_06630 [soil metagenome]
MRLSILAASLLVSGGLGLSACATGGSGQPSYNTALETLEAGCHEREGILLSSGATTGRPETDYYCKINGPTSRLPG